MAEELVNFLKKVSFDITFWIKFSINKEEVDHDGGYIPDIYLNEYYIKNVICFDLYEYINNYLGFKFKSTSSFISDGEIYSIFVDTVIESHYFVLIRDRDIIYTINTYGGIGRIVISTNYADDFMESWSILMKSKDMRRTKRNEEKVNKSFKVITGIEGVSPPYYLNKIRIKKAIIKDTYIDSTMNLVKNIIRPYFKNRLELKHIKELIKIIN